MSWSRGPPADLFLDVYKISEKRPLSENVRLFEGLHDMIEHHPGFVFEAKALEELMLAGLDCRHLEERAGRKRS